MSRIFHDLEFDTLLRLHCPEHFVIRKHLYSSEYRGWFAYDKGSQDELDALVAKEGACSAAETERMHALGYVFNEAELLAFRLQEADVALLRERESVSLVLSVPSPYGSYQEVTLGEGVKIRQGMGHEVTIHVDKSSAPVRIVCQDPCQVFDFSAIAKTLQSVFPDADVCISTGLVQQVKGETHCVLLAAINTVEFALRQKLLSRSALGEGLLDRSGACYRLVADLDKACLKPLQEFLEFNYPLWRRIQSSLRMDVCRLRGATLFAMGHFATESVVLSVAAKELMALKACLARLSEPLEYEENVAVGFDAHFARVKADVRELVALLEGCREADSTYCQALIAEIKAESGSIGIVFSSRQAIELEYDSDEGLTLSS